MITVKITNADQVQRALEQAPQTMLAALNQAGREAAERIILDTEGLKRYPPASAANLPPTPYYVRGRGTQYATGNAYNSERLGTQFYVRSANASTYIGNRTSYAPFVIGPAQSRVMARLGWRKLEDVAREKIDAVASVYQAWVDRALKGLGL